MTPAAISGRVRRRLVEVDLAQPERMDVGQRDGGDHSWLRREHGELAHHVARTELRDPVELGDLHRPVDQHEQPVFDRALDGHRRAGGERLLLERPGESGQHAVGSPLEQRHPLEEGDALDGEQHGDDPRPGLRRWPRASGLDLPRRVRA